MAAGAPPFAALSPRLFPMLLNCWPAVGEAPLPLHAAASTRTNARSATTRQERFMTFTSLSCAGDRYDGGLGCVP